MIPQSNWESLRALFEAALERPPASRSAFLRDQCGGHEATRREIESLLSAHEHAAGFLMDSALGPVRDDEPPTDAPRLMSGTQLGAFEIVERLGVGGMGEIYRARDTRLDRFVALKVLSARLEIAPRGRERFEREARAISKLSHPHICALHDVGAASVDGREVSYLVLELLDGETLAARLAGARLSVEHALDFAIDIADALAAAHDQGIVHRDLKPSNVMVTRSGVKLLDFGLAQLRLPERARDGFPATSSGLPLTSAGMVFGTLPYMSPEQVNGRMVDARSDIFSFGSVLHEMLTGQRAFAGDADRSSAARILSDEPKPVNELARSVPSELARIVSHCLRKDPARRYQYSADVKVALEDVRDAYRSAPHGSTSRTRPRWRWAAALFFVIAVLTGGFFAWRRPISPEAPAPRVVPLTTLQGSEASPTLAPDGEQVAFTWSGPNQDNDDIYIQRIGSGTESRRTVHPARDFSPTWSPDGRWIAFLRGEVPGRSELILVPPLGGAERPMGEIHIRQNYAVPPYLSWFPDSSALVIVDSPAPRQTDALYVISVETGEKRALTTPPSFSYPDSQPAVSPDGRRVAFCRHHELYVLALGEALTAATAPRLVAGRLAQQPAWTPDSRQIVYSTSTDRRLWKVDVSGERPPEAVPLVGQDAFMPVLSRSVSGKPSRLVYVRTTSDPNLWRLDLPGVGKPTSSASVVAIASTMADTNPQFSPDGKRVAFQSRRSGSWEVWTADPDGANPVQLTSMGAPTTGTPRWSPDGRTIAVDSSLEGRFEIYVVSAAGGKPRRMTFEPTDDNVPSFSRNGMFLYFCSMRSGVAEIWKVPVVGGDPVRITQNGGVVAFESLDERHLYYTQTHSGPSSLWRIPTAGGAPEKVLDGVSQRAFAVIEKGIYYLERQETVAPDPRGLPSGLVFSRPNDRTRLRFFDFASTTSRILADLGDRVAMGLAASPDGRTILFTRADNPSSDLMMVENFR